MIPILEKQHAVQTMETNNLMFTSVNISFSQTSVGESLQKEALKKQVMKQVSWDWEVAVHMTK